MSAFVTVEEAKVRVKELEEICSNRPSPLLLNDLAVAYHTMSEPDKALPIALAAWQMSHLPQIASTTALILKELGRHSESAEFAEIAYHLDPDNGYLRLGYGEALLKAGLWREAWPIYHTARQSKQNAAFDLHLPASVKEWHGEPLPEGHVLLVISEGGDGDRLSYARWIPELYKRGINWKFYPYDKLFPFFERIFPRERLIRDGENLVPDPTHWTTTFSLPAALNCGPTEIPKPLPFTVLPEKLEAYKFTRTDNLPIIGLCYKAAEQFQGGFKVRSLSEGQAMRLVCMTGDRVHYVNLQFGEKMPYPVTNLPFKDWEDTAGLIANLDGVVTVDTAVMHLAGALNKPTAVALGGNSCWKFLKSGRKLPLYPSATFYRNDGFGFENAISALVTDIRSGVWPF